VTNLSFANAIIIERQFSSMSGSEDETKNESAQARNGKFEQLGSNALKDRDAP